MRVGVVESDGHTIAPRGRRNGHISPWHNGIANVTAQPQWQCHGDM